MRAPAGGTSVKRSILVVGLAVAVLGVASVLAVGFAENGTWWPVFSPCASGDATWDQPGLFEQVDGPVPEPWSVSRQDPEGLPFENASLDRRFGEDGYALTRITWKHPPSAFSAIQGHYVELSARGEVTILADEAPNATRVAATFQAFAGNVTEADEATVDAWTDRLLASAQPGEHWGADESPGPSRGGTAYRVNVTQFALEDHVRRVGPPLGGPGDAEEPSGSVSREIGSLTVGTGAWGFLFEFETVTASNPQAEAPGVTEIRIDRPGRVTVDAELGDAENGETETIGAVRAAFDTLGWPEPALGTDDVRVVSTCR